MNHVPEALQYAAPFGWAIIAALVVMAYARPRLSVGGAVAAAAVAALLTKTVVLDLM